MTSSTTSSTTTTTSTSTTTTSSTTTTIAPTNKRVTQVMLGGKNVTQFCIEWTREETYGDTIPFMELYFSRNVADVVTLSTELELVVYEWFQATGYSKIWDGYVESFKPEGAKIRIIGRNKLADAIRKEITHVYDKSVAGPPPDPANPDGKISDIASDIIETYCGLTSEVQDSGETITLSKFVCNHADPLERLKKLQESLGWVLYYRDDTDKVYFEPKGFTTNSTVLTVGTNIIGIPKWTIAKDQMINDLTLEGAVLNETREELKSGDGSEKTFTVSSSEVPDFFDVYYESSTDFSSTSPTQAWHQVGVTEEITIGDYDYTYDLKNKSITFDTTTPANSANNILIRYGISTPNPIHRTNDESISAYGRNKRTITLTDVMNVEDAEQRCQLILDKFSQPFQTAKIKVLVSDSTWRVGQNVRVVDTVNSPNVDDTFVIIKIKKMYPGRIDEFTLGDQEWLPLEWQANILERVKRLEEQLVVDETVVNEIKDNKVEFGLVPDYQQIQLQRINDSFILGVAPNDILYDADKAMTIDDFEDTSKWVDTGITTAKSTMATTQGTDGDYLTGTGAIQFVGTVSGSFGLKNTSSLGDLSGCTGTGSGTPSQGTFGVWLNTTQTTNFTSTIQLQIGKDSSNYFTYNSQTYAQKVASDTTTWNLDSGWSLLLFDAKTPSSVTGTVTWTNSAYAELKGTVNGATTWLYDYFTASMNDTISKCGLGERFTTYSTLTTTY